MLIDIFVTRYSISRLVEQATVIYKLLSSSLYQGGWMVGWVNGWVGKRVLIINALKRERFNYLYPHVS